jgi:hypothetical protein
MYAPSRPAKIRLGVFFFTANLAAWSFFYIETKIFQPLPYLLNEIVKPLTTVAL